MKYIKKPVSNKWLDPANMYAEVVLPIMTLLTSPRWYEPDQVLRVKKLQRVSFSAQLIGLP